MDFGNWLATRRRERRLTMRDLAKRARLSAPYIATIEGNRSEPPPLRTCKALGRALGIPWQEIWQRAFAARLKRWLKREGYGNIAEAEVLDLVERIKSVARQPAR